MGRQPTQLQPSEPRPTHLRRSAFGAEVSSAVTGRAFGLVVAVLLLQLGFIASYVGAFHDPSAHRIPLAVAVDGPAPAGTAAKLAAELNAVAGSPLDARTAGSPAGARSLIRSRDVDGALVVDPSGTADTLQVASAEGAAVSTALTEVLTAVEAAQHRTVTTVDVIPAAALDARGLSSFYAAVGWIVGGYLCASLLSISAGSRKLNRERAVIRLCALALYAIASGIGGAVLVGPVFGALTGHAVEVAALGALVVFAAGSFTVALQALTGVIGIGLTVLIFVVLGNPSAGGAYPYPLLPPFWRAIGPWLPPGAGTSALRGIVYFGDAGVVGPVVVLASYALLGAVVTLVAAGRRRAADPDLAVE
jgi:hypothetical protein